MKMPTHQSLTDDTVAIMRKKKVAYYRISLDRTGEEVGVDRQRHETEAAFGTFDEEVVDNDLSAMGKVERPGFESIVSRSDIEVLYVWHVDRLVRVTGDLEKVIALDIPVHAVKSGHIDLSNPAGRAVARTITAWSTYEQEQKGLRQKAAHDQRRRSGKPFWSSNPPLGYDAVGNVVTHEAGAIRLGYEMILEGHSLADVARTWQEAGVERRRGSTRPWDTGRVGDVLRHPRNAALVTRWSPERGGDEIVGKAAWEPIIDEDLWRVAQVRMEHGTLQRRGQGRKNSLLSGVAKCMACGGPMAAGPTQRSKKDGSPMRYYRCRDNRCVNASMPALDKIVEDRLLALLYRPSVTLRQKQKTLRNDRAVEIADELAKVTSRLMEMEEDYASGDMSKAEWQRMSGIAKDRVSRLGMELEKYSSPEPMAGRTTVKQLIKDWREGGLTIEEKQRVLREWFEEIGVVKKGRARLKPEHVILIERE